MFEVFKWIIYVLISILLIISSVVCHRMGTILKDSK